MLKKTGRLPRLLIMVFVIIVIPNLLINLIDNWKKSDFREEAEINRETCYERAERDGFSKTICDQIIMNASNAQYYSFSTHISIVLILTMTIFGLANEVIGLESQIDELKEKLNA